MTRLFCKVNSFHHQDQAAVGHTPLPANHARGEPGFALVAVLALTVLIMTMVPMMLSLSRENITGVQGDQIRARVSEQARQMFMIGQTSMQMNAGLPVGWQQGSAAATEAVATMVNCSGFLDRDDETWAGQDARISIMTLDNNTDAIGGTTLAMGVYRSGYGDVTYEQYTVIGCAISDSPNSQGAVMRGEFALTGQRMMLLGLEANGT